MALIEKLSAIGDAIREKNGTSDLIPLADMPQAIREISSGNNGVNTESTLSTANTLICTFWDNRQAIKTNDGLAIVGQLWNGTNLRIFSVAKTKTEAQFHYANFTDTPKDSYFEYDGATYCLYSSSILYAKGLATDGVPPIDISKIVPLNANDSEGKKLLDYYYGKTKSN
jgi:hypothetical protein